MGAVLQAVVPMPQLDGLSRQAAAVAARAGENVDLIAQQKQFELLQAQHAGLPIFKRLLTAPSALRRQHTRTQAVSAAHMVVLRAAPRLRRWLAAAG